MGPSAVTPHPDAADRSSSHPSTSDTAARHGVGPVAELRDRAMGTDVQIVVTGAPDATETHVTALAELGRQRIAELESAWTRFDASSELRRLCAAAGRPMAVSAATRTLLRTMIAMWHRSGGLFDPTVGRAVAAAGYDDDFTLVAARAAATRPSALGAEATPGCSGIVVDDLAGTATVPVGVELDAGGVGKGLTADLVVARLMAGGADGALVNIGGDLRVAGRSNDGHDDWMIRIAEPTVELDLDIAVEGAVATSTDRRRRWLTSSGVAHHLIDPADGRPVDSPVALVTTFAPDAATAEVATKVVYIGWPVLARSELSQRLDALGAAALVVTDDGGRHVIGDAPITARLRLQGSPT